MDKLQDDVGQSPNAHATSGDEYAAANSSSTKGGTTTLEAMLETSTKENQRDPSVNSPQASSKPDEGAVVKGCSETGDDIAPSNLKNPEQRGINSDGVTALAQDIAIERSSGCDDASSLNAAENSGRDLLGDLAESFDCTKPTDIEVEVTEKPRRILYYDEIFDKANRRYTLVRRTKATRKRFDKQHVLIVKRKHKANGVIEGSRVDIRSRDLCAALIDINKDVKDLELSSSSSEADVKLFYFSYEGLVDRLRLEKEKPSCNNDLIADLATGIEFTEKEFKEELGHKSNDIAQGRIVWSDIWSIFAPNTLMYYYDKLREAPRLLLIRSCRERLIGRVMIDAKAFRTFNQNSVLLPKVHTSVSFDAITPLHLKLCPPEVLGFSLEDNQWAAFSTARLTPAMWNQNALTSLDISPKQKELIKSLVEQHPFHQHSNCHLERKGNGLICLFAGAPGCGKTLTAEVVAEACQKPLYRVNAGSFGPQTLSDELAEVLKISVTWGAIVLIDEADVFMETRDFKDIERNVVVAVFLAQLEYFEGILMLTTNRSDNIDPAFESRIHISIRYPDLDVAARARLWRSFLADDIQFPQHIVSKLAKSKLNGRQIKNAIHSAQSLAKSQKEDLRLSHLEIVLDIIKDWKQGRRGLGRWITDSVRCLLELAFLPLNILRRR